MSLTLSQTLSFESSTFGNLNLFLFHVLIFFKFQAAEQLMISHPLSAKGLFFFPTCVFAIIL